MLVPERGDQETQPDTPELTTCHAPTGGFATHVIWPEIVAALAPGAEAAARRVILATAIEAHVRGHARLPKTRFTMTSFHEHLVIGLVCFTIRPLCVPKLPKAAASSFLGPIGRLRV